MLEEETTNSAQETIDADNSATDRVDENADINNEESVNDASFEDSESDEGQKEEKPKQTQEQNSENARRRREAERQKELKQARENAIIETLGGKNPYTGEPMTDSLDVEEYLAMKEIEKSGGDPLTDYSKFTKSKLKEAESKKVEEQQKKEWFEKDRDEFFNKYPDVDMETLLKDNAFKKFAVGKVGNQPMSQIYEDYQEMVNEYEKKSKQYASKLLANSKATPGSLHNPTNNSNSVFFSKEEVEKMTPSEVKVHYETIMKSMKKW